MDLETFGRALAGVEERLDWERLGVLYCDGDGADFFDGPQREADRDAGLRFAADLGELLAPEGRSLYVGAALAELVQILFEATALRRTVTWVNIDCEEARMLTGALESTGSDLGLELPRPIFTALPELPPTPHDHLWFASVLTDPEAFPALHRTLYERLELEDPGPEALRQERARASDLALEALCLLEPPGLVSTSEEELPFFLAAAKTLGTTIRVPELARTSPIVGDTLRLCPYTED